jgi:hypothetical protein
MQTVAWMGELFFNALKMTSIPLSIAAVIPLLEISVNLAASALPVYPASHDGDGIFCG